MKGLKAIIIDLSWTGPDVISSTMCLESVRQATSHFYFVGLCKALKGLLLQPMIDPFEDILTAS